MRGKREPIATTGPRRAGFTMTEMLLVIALIGIVASLISVAAIQALNRGKEARITLEIDQLAAAAESFKSKFGSYPPGAGTLTNTSGTSTPIAETALERRARLLSFVSRAFSQYPVADYPSLQYQVGLATLRAPDWAAAPGSGSNVPDFTPATRNCCDLDTLDAAEALVFWLGGLPRRASGVTGSLAFELTRFNADPTNPFAIDTSYAPGSVNGAWGNNRSRTDKFFEFDPTRLVDLDQDGWPEYAHSGQDVTGTPAPYVYFEGTSYALQPAYPDPAPRDATDAPGDNTQTIHQSLMDTLGLAKPYARDLSNTNDTSVFDWGNRTTWRINWIEPDRFQILSAGRDAVLGQPPIVMSSAMSEQVESRDTVLRLYPSGSRTPMGAEVPPVVKTPGYGTYDNLSNFFSGRLESELTPPGQ